MDLIQLNIKKDKNIIKYISIIRKFDSSLAMSTIKNRIENKEIVIEFALEYYDVLEELNCIDRKREFRHLISKLIKAGGEILIYHNGELISLELLDNWLETLEEIKRSTEFDIDRELGEE